MRRLLKDNRGQVRVIEAFLSSMLILACLTLIPAQITDTATSDEVLLTKAQNVLISLDSDGQIGKLVDNHDWATLGDCLESALPLTVWFNMTVYDSNNNCLNDYPICSSGAVSDEVVSFSYICASPDSAYSVYVLQLQMAVVD